MRRIRLIVIAASLFLGWGITMAQSNPQRKTAEFPGACLKWVHIAEPEFQRKNLDLDVYTISVVEREDSVTIVLRSSEAPEGARGSMGKHPGYEIEISKTDFKITRSNYVR